MAGTNDDFIEVNNFQFNVHAMSTSILLDIILRLIHIASRSFEELRDYDNV